ncbi:MAG: UDP-N-acetylmuramate:L-alanyl-gamma-D-glutamyl-meso-diaminopimelate ligase [Candidatus Saccharibacteria bacterium]|nr:UDP-N-acetylmuramate:L-alanyl-gamma-D-glutamyl-meso-diaminopimelate ligase [Candidatus Saccharibacteria bacterium]
MKGHLYFIGITGHAIRGVALAARDLGYEVSGLDEPAVPPGSDWVTEQGIPWKRQYNPSQLEGVTAVIVTGAHVSDSYPPIRDARRQGIAIKSYAQLVGELTSQAHVISVAGTHGKTTTTSLIAWLLESAGRKPDFLVGIRPFNFESSVRLSGSKVMVAEGDEYRASKLEDKSKVEYYHPDTLVLTSVEHDHPDMFPDLASVVKRFRHIVAGLPKTGRLVVWSGSETVIEIAESAKCSVITYGLDAGDYIARDIAYQPTGIEFDVEFNDEILGRIAVPLYGKHNVLNVLAAVAVCLSEGLTFDQILDGAAGFKGAYRRFNIVSSPGAPVTVVDDYAHHPTEATTNIEAAKLHFPERRVVVVYRPHTYTRTAALLKEYQRAFDRADLVYITDIEGAREAGLEHSVSGNDIVQALKVPALYTANRADLIKHTTKDSKPGDIILCFTVSGYDEVARELAAKLNG